MSSAQEDFEETLGHIDRCIKRFSTRLPPAETVPTLTLCADLARQLASAADRYSASIRAELLPLP